MLLGTAALGIWLMTRGVEATSSKLAVNPNRLTEPERA
jgi:hypothetical protein